MSFRQDTDKGPWPRYVFEHHQGWDVIKSGPRRYRLSWEGRFGYIAAFTTLDVAIDYMNNEFL